MAAALDHIAIAVSDLEDACRTYTNLGFEIAGIEEVAHEQVRVAMLPAAGAERGSSPMPRASAGVRGRQTTPGRRRPPGSPERLRSGVGSRIAGGAVASKSGCAASMLPRIELIEPTSSESTVGRFIARRGEGLHHIAVRVHGLADTIARLKAAGASFVSEKIQRGAGGHQYVFLKPASARGVLIELVEA